MSLGLTLEKMFLILFVAAVIIGPERLPRYATMLAELTKTLRRSMRSLQDRMRQEMGPDFDDFDWKKLDPRQYDPRQIVRSVFAESEDRPSTTTTTAPPPPPDHDRQTEMTSKEIS